MTCGVCWLGSTGNYLINYFQTIKINHFNYIASSGYVIFSHRYNKISQEVLEKLGRISLWQAKPPRDHEFMLDRAIELANTGNSLNFLVRVHCGWAGQSLSLRAAHLCIFTFWFNDKFKTKQALPPEKHKPWNDEWQILQRKVLSCGVLTLFFKKDLCLL